MTQNTIDLKKGLFPFTITVTLVSFPLFVYLYLGREPVPEVEGFSHELGEGLGNAGIVALAVIYGRSALKMLRNEGTLLQRFVPEDYQDLSHSASRRLLNFLNRTHRYVGAAAVGLLLGHALLMGTARWNLFLELLLVLLTWQALFGLFLVIRFPVSSLKRYSYLVHAQLFTGVMLGIFAIFGHLLV